MFYNMIGIVARATLFTPCIQHEKRKIVSFNVLRRTYDIAWTSYYGYIITVEQNRV